MSGKGQHASSCRRAQWLNRTDSGYSLNRSLTSEFAQTGHAQKKILLNPMRLCCVFQNQSETNVKQSGLRRHRLPYQIRRPAVPQGRRAMTMPARMAVPLCPALGRRHGNMAKIGSATIPAPIVRISPIETPSTSAAAMRFVTGISAHDAIVKPAAARMAIGYHQAISTEAAGSSRISIV